MWKQGWLLFPPPFPHAELELPNGVKALSLASRQVRLRLSSLWASSEPSIRTAWHRQTAESNCLIGCQIWIRQADEAVLSEKAQQTQSVGRSVSASWPDDVFHFGLLEASTCAIPGASEFCKRPCNLEYRNSEATLSREAPAKSAA